MIRSYTVVFLILGITSVKQIHKLSFLHSNTLKLPHHCSTDTGLFCLRYLIEFPGLVFLQFSFDICQCSEIYFKHQLTLSGFPGGICADKISWLAHRPCMSGGNQSRGRWLTQRTVPRSVRNNNSVWEGIQSESGPMMLIQLATSDKAPMLSATTGSSSPTLR